MIKVTDTGERAAIPDLARGWTNPRWAMPQSGKVGPAIDDNWRIDLS